MIISLSLALPALLFGFLRAMIEFRAPSCQKDGAPATRRRKTDRNFHPLPGRFGAESQNFRAP
jgi:hypothetical protein